MAPWALLVALCVSSCRSTTARDPESRPRAGYGFAVEGNESLSRDALRKAVAYELGEFERSEYDRALADDTAYQARVHYRSLGYPFAEVAFRLERLEDGRPRLVLLVTEGPLVTVDDRLELVGVEAFSRDEVRALLDLPRTGLFGGGAQLYVPDRVAAIEARLTEWRGGPPADVECRSRKATSSQSSASLEATSSSRMRTISRWSRASCRRSSGSLDSTAATSSSNHIRFRSLST